MDFLPSPIETWLWEEKARGRYIIRTKKGQRRKNYFCKWSSGERGKGYSRHQEWKMNVKKGEKERRNESNEIFLPRPEDLSLPFLSSFFLHTCLISSEIRELIFAAAVTCRHTNVWLSRWNETNPIYSMYVRVRVYSKAWKASRLDDVNDVYLLACFALLLTYQRLPCHLYTFAPTHTFDSHGLWKPAEIPISGRRPEKKGKKSGSLQKHSGCEKGLRRRRSRIQSRCTRGCRRSYVQ